MFLELTMVERDSSSCRRLFHQWLQRRLPHQRLPNAPRVSLHVYHVFYNKTKRSRFQTDTSPVTSTPSTANTCSTTVEPRATRAVSRADPHREYSPGVSRTEGTRFQGTTTTTLLLPLLRLDTFLTLVCRVKLHKR